MNSPILICFGEVLWDLLPDGARIGGAPANCAVLAHQLGIHSVLVSAVGNDRLGEEIIERVAQRGLATDFIQRIGEAPTGTVEVKVDSRGVPAYEIKENVAWDAIAANPELDLLASTARAVSFGTLAQRVSTSRGMLRRILSMAPPDSIRYFDVNLRRPYVTEEVLCESLAFSTILKLNDEELPIVARAIGIATSDIVVFIRAIFERFPIRVIVLTKGRDGAEIHTPQRSYTIPIQPVLRLVDTVGAGDAFSAGLLSVLLQGGSIEDAGHMGAQCASRICECSGAWSSDDSLKLGIE